MKIVYPIISTFVLNTSSKAHFFSFVDSHAVSPNNPKRLCSGIWYTVFPSFRAWEIVIKPTSLRLELLPYIVFNYFTEGNFIMSICLKSCFYSDLCFHFQKCYQGTRLLGWHCRRISYRHPCLKASYGVQHILWSERSDKGQCCQSLATLEKGNAIIWVNQTLFITHVCFSI